MCIKKTKEKTFLQLVDMVRSKLESQSLIPELSIMEKIFHAFLSRDENLLFGMC